MEEDLGDSGYFSKSRSFSEDDSIVEGAMAHGGGDRAATSLEGEVVDTGTNPSRGCQSIQMTTLSHVVQQSLMHGAPSAHMEKRRKLVHARTSSDAGGPSILVGPVSLPPPSTSSVDAPTMVIMMPIAVRGNPLRPHSFSDAFMAVHHGRATKEKTSVVPPLFWPTTTSALAVVQAASTSLLLAVDILSPLIATSIATPVASTPDVRVSVPIGGALIEGILPPSFSLQLETGVHSMSPTGSSSP